MAEARNADRKTIAAEVQLRRSGEINFVVNAFDLSLSGCKVEFVNRPRLGETVWVKFPQLASIESNVRWIGNFAVGLKFVQPISPYVLESLLKQLR
jgi:hypothetical protein